MLSDSMTGLLLKVKGFFLILILTASLLRADYEYTISNTNFTLSQGSALPSEKKDYLYNYNRLRYRGDYTQENYFSTLIGDIVNYLGQDYINSTTFNFVKGQASDTPFKTRTSYHGYDRGEVYAKLYRLYGGYEDDKNRLVVGLQNISMGVGRIWTPTNLYNPRNTYALEPDEVFGVAGILYTRHLNETTEFTAIVSQKKDHSFKYGARIKSYLDFADVGLNLVSSDKTKMLGYELEGNLGDTGVEIRSEGAYIKNTLKSSLITEDEKEFFQGIVGADYGFENGITLITEALYSSQTFSYNEIFLNIDSEIASNLYFSHFYAGATLSYAFNLFLDASLAYIESFNDKNSRFISPSVSYTLNDFNSFSIGAMIQNGPGGSEFGGFANTYYFKYSLSF